jgi:hypothetical protein
VIWNQKHTRENMLKAIWKENVMHESEGKDPGKQLPTGEHDLRF